MADPRVAVVIPIHRQPSLAIESIESVLRQQTSFDYRVVLVNDGCPFAETDETCRTYARRYPDRIRYLHRRNGGLSAARNTGADFALQAWPGVEAIQFLDADDRLGPRSLQLAYDALNKNPDASWAYPNWQQFGSSHDYVSMDGPWSTLELAAQNYIMPASLVRRDVFQRGLRFDETMKLGFEDWDFWMQCARDGLRGVHVPETDFQYRVRGESMLVESGRSHETIVSYLRRKHRDWCTPRRALEIEHAEHPRYAIYLTDENRVLLTSDPFQSDRSIPLTELGVHLARAAANPRLIRFPHYLVVTSAAFLQIAQTGRFAGGLFWQLQREHEQNKTPITMAKLQEWPGARFTLTVWPANVPLRKDLDHAAMAILSTRTLHGYLTEMNGDSLQDYLRSHTSSTVRSINVEFVRPAPEQDFRPDALKDLARLVDTIGPEYRSRPAVCLTHGMASWRSTGDSTELTRKIFGSGPTFPHLMDRSKIQIGFVVPICNFGGAERATMNFGREARRRGWTPHLFVVGSGIVQLLPEFRDTFETITPIESWQLYQPDLLQGLLSTLDVVVNNLCAPVNEVFSSLRRNGVLTICHLHSVIISQDQMPSGQVYEMLRYEHSIDGVIVISKKLQQWCRAWGVPEAKLIPAANAPSFEVSDGFVKTVLENRVERMGGPPLNVLYLGRFDWEKGMDRLLAVYERTRQESLPVNWRIVGGYVCGPGMSSRDLGPIQKHIEPPVMTATGLSRLYSWADVVVMVSRFEGVPLTLLEGQQHGCAVLSTRVGAVDEIIDPGRTGFLFSNDLDTPELADQIVGCLRRLHDDRELLLEIARAGAALRRRTTWSVNFQAFAHFVESHLRARGTDKK